MANVAKLSVSQPFNFRLGLGIPILSITLLLMFDPSRLDFALQRLFYSPGTGFIGSDSFWLEDILHDRAKQAVILLGVAAIIGFLWSLLPTRLRAWRAQLGYVVLTLALATSIVTPLKILTEVHCPWSLSEFGGSEIHTPLLSARAPSDKPGRCWPGGHASAGFSLVAFYFALRDRRPKSARITLGIALGLGLAFSIGRMLQGAHFLSHNLWTFLLDWLICVLCYRWILYRPPKFAHS